MQWVNGGSVIETNDIGVCDGQAARVWHMLSDIDVRWPVIESDQIEFNVGH